MIRVSAGAINAAVVDLGNVGKRLRPAVMQGLQAAGEELYRAVDDNLAATCHTQADLDRLDNPYAKRHGSIRIHPERPYLVHQQTGRGRRSLRRQLMPMQDFFEVWLDLSAAPHMERVIQGTKVMLPRDTLWLTAGQRATRKAMLTAFVRVLGKELKTKAMVRFTGRVGTGPRT